MNQPPHTGGRLRPAAFNPLDDAFGFVLDDISPHKVLGHLIVTKKCCQPFGVLHGGVTAMIAEDLASYGAVVASGFNRVAGTHLSINHVKSAVVGDLVFAQATPINVGKALQVWNVRISKCDPSNTEIKTLISTSTVTLFCKFAESQTDKEALQRGIEYAKAKL